jgi:hypothetical protein
MTIAFGLSGSLADTLTNRPAPDPDKIGRFFLDTDAGTLYRDGGTAWLRVRDDATDRPRGGSLIIQTNDEHALQVEKLVSHDVVEFDQEVADPLNLINGYEGLTGVSSAISNNGILYFDVEKYGTENPNWRIVIYSAADRTSESMVAVTAWSHISKTVEVLEVNESGLSGTLDLTDLTESTGQISAHWTITPTITPAEIFNVNTLTGVVTLPAGTAEPPLGNPDATGKVLTSTPEGLRSWIAQSGGSSPNALLERPRPAEESPYDDEFEEGSLDEKWTVENNSCVVDINDEWPSWLHMRTNTAGAAYTLTQAFAPSSDFSITIKGSINLQANYGGISILAANDNESEAIWGLIQSGGYYVYLHACNAGQWAWSQRLTQLGTADAGTWWLHMERRGNNWYVFASRDGRAWTLAGMDYHTKSFTVAKIKIALYADQQAYPKDGGFDYFRVNDFWVGIH